MKNNDEIIYVLTANQYGLGDKEWYITFNNFAISDEDIIKKKGKLRLKKYFKFNKFKFKFDNNCIYKLKVKKTNNEVYDVINILEKNCNHKKLEEVKKMINDGHCIEYLGYKFKLNNDNSWYEAKSNQIDIVIDAKKENIFELCDNKGNLIELLDKSFQEKVQNEVSEKLLEKANEWIDSNDNIKYTSDMLYNTFKLESIYINENDCSFCYDAKDIFGGHYIQVYIKKNEITDIEING